MSNGAASTRSGWFGRLLRARWFPFAAGGVAVVLLTTTAIVASQRFAAPAATRNVTQYAPTAFPTSMQLTSLPVISRGQTAHVQLQSLGKHPISSVEFYDNAQLYLTVTPPKGQKTSRGIVTTEDLDFAPLVAGIHILTARVTDSSGQVSVPPPVQLPVLDGTAAGGTDGRLASYGAVPTTASTVSVRTSPGETLESLAHRLGTTPRQVSFPIIDGQNPLPAAHYSLHSPLPTGILADSPLVSPQKAIKLGGYHAPARVKPTGPVLIAVANGCTVTVSVPDSSPSLALYASTPLQPGMIRIGDVSPNHPYVSSTLPVGPSTFEGYNVNATSADTSGANAPTAPASATVPDLCASEGWSGTAKIINGILLTDDSLDSPYAYVSVDAGNWQRVPGDQSQTLTTGTINDLRNYLTLGKYDQLDVQVWSFDGSTALMGAQGEFCRKDIKNADPSASSGSTTQCRPPGTSPGGGATDTSKDNVFIHESVAGSLPPDTATDPVVTQSIRLTKDTPVKLLVSVTDDFAEQVELQFSYFPISPDTTAVAPPGVFHELVLQLNQYGVGTTTFNPWKWRDAKATDTPSTFDAGGESLSLDDQVAYDLAKANLAAGKDLIDTVYVRAVSITTSYQKTDSITVPAVASHSVEVDMKDTKTYPKIDSAQATLIPGNDEHATDVATRGECWTLVGLPPAGTYLAEPTAGAHQFVVPVSGEVINIPADPSQTDQALAISKWGQDQSKIHCLDPNADAERQADADAAAAAADNSCGLFCFIAAAVIGAVVGFALGGPIGALAGAAAGIGLAVGDPTGVAELEGGLETVWTLIVDEYNTIYGSILQVVGELNPVCLAVSASSSKAAQTCADITADVVAAAVTYFTGFPRTLPTSDELADLVNGQLQSFIEGAIQTGVSAVGLDCDDLTMSASDGDDVATAADKVGATGAQSALNDAKEPDGSYSFCHGLAGALTNAISSQYNSFDSGIMAQAMEAPIYPGMTVIPFEDAAPTLVVLGTGTQSVLIGSTCPATVDMTVHLPGVGTYDPATKQTYNGPDLNWHLAIQSFTLTASASGGATAWGGTLRLPLLPSLTTYDDSRVRDSTPAAAGDPYLTLAIDSPCLSTTLNLVATKYVSGGAPYAFVDDERLGYYYH